MSETIKQFVHLLRRAGHTFKAFHNYHYQQHGSISQASDPQETPLQHFQTHFFDSVYSHSNLAQPVYTGHNDFTELYFASPEHMARVFFSTHGREEVGPDGANFNNFAAAIAIFASEKTIFDQEPEETLEADQQAITETYWLQTISEDAHSIATVLNDLVKTAFQAVSLKIVSHLAFPDPDEMSKYFQGKEAPPYSAALQVYLPDATSVERFEEARRKLESSETFQQIVRTDTTSVVFGIRSAVFDPTRKIVFEPPRQPRLP